MSYAFNYKTKPVQLHGVRAVEHDTHLRTFCGLIGEMNGTYTLLDMSKLARFHVTPHDDEIQCDRCLHYLNLYLGSDNQRKYKANNTREWHRRERERKRKRFTVEDCGPIK